MFRLVLLSSFFAVSLALAFNYTFLVDHEDSNNYFMFWGWPWIMFEKIGFLAIPSVSPFRFWLTPHYVTLDPYMLLLKGGIFYSRVFSKIFYTRSFSTMRNRLALLINLEKIFLTTYWFLGLVPTDFWRPKTPGYQIAARSKQLIFRYPCVVDVGDQEDFY
jgi:hypothetical protein